MDLRHSLPKRTASTSGRLVALAIDEALSAIAAPAIVERVMHLALRSAQLREIPEDGDELADFIDGALFVAVSDVLGEQAAHVVRDELASLVRLMEEGEISVIRASWPALPGLGGPALRRHEEDLEFTPLDAQAIELTPLDAQEPAQVSRRGVALTNPAPRRELPLVLVASSDPSSVSRLSFALSGIAVIEPVRDALAALEAMGRGVRNVMVLDAQHPTVQAETLLAMQPELPAESLIVLWGELPQTRRRLAALGAGMPESWTCCGTDASVEDVAAVCRVLLE